MNTAAPHPAFRNVTTFFTISPISAGRIPAPDLAFRPVSLAQRSLSNPALSHRPRQNHAVATLSVDGPVLVSVERLDLSPVSWKPADEGSPSLGL